MDTKKLRQKILDLAIRGKLVPQDPNDEPASVLLERIRAEKEQLIKEGKIKRSKKSASTDKSHYENVPFEIPESWCWCRLSELCIFLSRGRSPKYSEERLFPVFAQKCNLKDGGISLGQARFLDPSTIGKWGEDYKLKGGDVLVNSTGTGTVGRTRLFDECCLGKYPFVVPDSHVSVVRTVAEIDSFYIWAILSSNWGQQYLEDNLAGSTNQKELYIGVLEDIFIPLPPKNEQKKIAKEIARWEKYVDNIDVVKAELSNYIKQTKSKILDLAISGKLLPQDPTDEPAIELLKRINPNFKPCDNSHYENLPQGWAVCKIKDIFNITMGQSPTGESINGVKGIEFHQGKIHFTELYLSQSGVYTDQPTKIAEVDSLLLCVRAPVGVLNITQRKICIGRGLCALKPKYEIDNLYWLFILSAFKDYFESNATGSTFKAISGDTIKNAVIKLPPLQEQERILSSIISLYESLDAITAEL